MQQEVKVNKAIQVSAKKAWIKLSSFKGIEEYSPIQRSVTNGVGAGATRTCYLPDGAAIHEELSTMEDQNMEFQYKITEGPFPVTDYVSTVKVKSTGADSCQITWSCTFDCEEKVKDDMMQLFGGFYNVIIESLECLIQNEN